MLFLCLQTVSVHTLDFALPFDVRCYSMQSAAENKLQKKELKPVNNNKLSRQWVYNLQISIYINTAT